MLSCFCLTLIQNAKQSKNGESDSLGLEANKVESVMRIQCLGERRPFRGDFGVVGRAKYISKRRYDASVLGVTVGHYYYDSLESEPSMPCA